MAYPGIVTRTTQPSRFEGRHHLATLILIISLTLAKSNLLSEPTLRWSHQLKGAGDGLSGRNLRKGNAVVAHEDESKVFATTDDGSLHIIDTNAATPSSIVFEPEKMNGKSTECRSGLILVDDFERNESPNEYIVYAVVDVPVSTGVEYQNNSVNGNNGSETVSSRVLAVNFDGSIRWSLAVEGRIAGTPVQGRDRLLYISRNVDNTGYLSVIMVDSANPEVTASLTSSGAPYGPPSISLPFRGGNQNVPDEIVAIAESTGRGYMDEGSVYVLLRTTEFEDSGGRGNESYELKLVTDRSVTSVAPLLFREESLWLVGASASLQGWTENGDLSRFLEGRIDSVDPRWSIQVERNDRNESQPLLSTPAISSDGSQLFFPGASNEFYCVQSSNGRETWTDSLGGLVLTEPKLFEGNNVAVVYVIDTLEGKVLQYAMSDGSKNWEFSHCEAGGEASICQESVEAEFSVASTGNVIYYGDIFGRIYSLEVGAYETEQPTAFPSYSPSSSPTITPSESLVPSNIPSSLRSNMPTAAFSTPMPSAVSTGGNSVEVPPVTSDESAPSEVAPTGAPPSVFQPPISFASGVGKDTDSEQDLNGLTVIVSAALCGALLIAILLLLIVRSQKSKKSDKLVEVSSNESNDLESSAPGTSQTQSKDAITVTSDSVEVEVLGGAAVYSPTKRKSRKKKKNLSPVTPATLESIEEVPEEFTPEHTNVVLLDDDADISNESVSKDLNEAFQLIAEVQTFEENSDEESYAMSVETGSAGQSKDGTHLELAVGNNQLNPIEDDIINSPQESGTEPKYLLNGSQSNMTREFSEEEKKEGDTVETENRDKIMQEPFSETSPRVSDSTIHVADPLIEPSPVNHLSPLSTNSSVYLSESGSPKAPETPVSLSPNILPNSPDEDAPEDEAEALGSMKARLIMQQPALSHRYNERTSESSNNLDALDDEVIAPGSHYMPSNSELSTTANNRMPTVADATGSIESSPGKSKYGKSVRSRRSTSFASTNDSKLDTRKDHSRAQNRKPSFKRRSKWEEKEDKDPAKQEDTWSSFLKDLAAAEEAFFSPTAAQKSSILKYEDSDSASGGSDRLEDDQLAVEGSEEALNPSI